MYEFDLEVLTNQTGMTLQNGAKIRGSRISLVGGAVTASATSNTGYILGLDVGNPSGICYIEDTEFLICIEIDSTVSGGGLGVGQTSIVLGSTNGGGMSGHGVLQFVPTPHTPTWQYFQGASIAGGSHFAVYGHINDLNLGILSLGDCAVVHGGTQWAVAGSNTQPLFNNATIYPASGDVQEFQLISGAKTVAAFGGMPYACARKLDLLLHQPSSGYPATLTWPSSVQWAGGNSSLSTANGAVDRVRLMYYPSDNIWYGEVIKGFSATAGNNSAYLTLTSPKTSAYTAAVGDMVIVDCTAGAVTITAPSGAVDGSRFGVKRVDATYNAAVVATISRSGSDVFDVSATSMTLPLQSEEKTFQYKASSGIWYAVAGDFGLGTLDTRYLTSPTITTPTLTNPTLNGYVEGRQPLGTVTTTKTIPALSNGTICTATLTDATSCAFTLPAPVAGTSFVLFVFQSAAGTGSYTFTTPSGTLYWPATGTPTATSGVGMVDMITFITPLGTNWYGSYSLGY